MVEKRFIGGIISEWDFIQMAKDYLKESDWPDGCEVLAVNYDFQKQAFVLKIYHDEFDILTQGCMMPYKEIKIKKEEENG